LLLTGNNTYTGGTLIGGGTLQVGNGGTSGTLGTGGVANNGTLAVNRSDTVTLDVDISGTGAFSQIGSGTTILSGTNTYSGTTTINAGTLQVGNGGTSGQLGTGAVVNNAALIFDRSDAVLAQGAISGAGTLTQLGPGTTILTGANTYSGTTTISNGVLQVGNGGTTGQLGAGAVIDNSSLVFNRSDAIAVTNAIAGSGTLSQDGTGTLMLSGAKSYTGNTFANVGTLLLDGSLAGSVVVAPGATFGGTGAIAGSMTVAGTVTVGSANASPGASAVTDRRLSPLSVAGTSSLGTLQVAGNVTLAPGSRDVVTIDASGNHTWLIAGGTAAVAGATITVQPRAGSYGRVTYFPVLSARGGVTGTAKATSTQSALDAWATTTADELVITLLNTDVSLATSATTMNGGAIGTAFDRIRGRATGDFANVVRELTALDDPGLDAALGAVAGEIHASAVQLAALDGESVTDLIRSRSASRGAVEGMPAASGQSFSLGHGLWSRLQTERTEFASSSLHGGTAQTSGFVVGMNRPLADRWSAGLGGSYSWGNLGLERLQESSAYTAPRVFGSVGYENDRWTLHAGASLARTSYDTRRSFLFTARLPEAFGSTAIFGGVNRVSTSKPTGIATDVWGDWAVPLQLGTWSVRPTAALRYARYARGPWTEHGADALSLSAPDQFVASAQSDAGIHLARVTGLVRPTASATYRRELTSGRTTSSLQLGNLADGGFQVDGVPFAQDTFMVRTGLTFQTDNLDMSVGFDFKRSSGQTRQGLQIGLGF
jgi:autotransporter-associated beta strand protein